jgi:hypothetical protein
MKKIRVGVNELGVQMKRLGCRGESRSWSYPTERQGSVLTNQCLGKEMNCEQGAEESFLTDSDNFILVEIVVMTWQSRNAFADQHPSTETGRSPHRGYPEAPKCRKHLSMSRADD